jgi:hypothetical protein
MSTDAKTEVKAITSTAADGKDAKEAKIEPGRFGNLDAKQEKVCDATSEPMTESRFRLPLVKRSSGNLLVVSR